MTTEKCDGCGILEHGKIYDEEFSDYRGYKICQWCIKKWKQHEVRVRRKAGLAEYRVGIKRRKK